MALESAEYTNPGLKFKYVLLSRVREFSGHFRGPDVLEANPSWTTYWPYWHGTLGMFCEIEVTLKPLCPHQGAE